MAGNGAEGEPLSRKDTSTVKRAPHLVLDGLAAAAAAIGADAVYLYLHADAVPTVNKALAERRSVGLDRHRVAVIEAPDRFVAGEESAVTRYLEGGPPAAGPHRAHRGLRSSWSPDTGQQRRDPGPHRIDRPIRAAVVPFGGR